MHERDDKFCDLEFVISSDLHSSGDSLSACSWAESLTGLAMMAARDDLDKTLDGINRFIDAGVNEG